MGYSGGHVHVGLRNSKMPFVFLCSFGKGQRKSATHIHAASVKQILCVLIIDTLYVLLRAANRKEGDGVGGPQLERKKLCPKLMPSAEREYGHGLGASRCLGRCFSSRVATVLSWRTPWPHRLRSWPPLISEA